MLGIPGGVEVRLLGPLDVLVDGVPVTLGGPRPRALFVMLALSAGTAVPTGRLIEAIWDARPPARATNTVQVYVSRLRRLLRTSAGEVPLRAAPGGYLLDVPAEAIDLRRFERLAAEGHALLVRGDPAAAAATLDSALALWRGPLADLSTSALGELSPSAMADGLLARLQAQRLAVQVEWLDAATALGRHAFVAGELAELVRLHPLDEGLVARMMVALYRSGRQADALAAYTAAARRLADELGVDPGPQLRRVHADVLQQRVPPGDGPAAELPASPIAGPVRAGPEPGLGPGPGHGPAEAGPVEPSPAGAAPGEPVPTGPAPVEPVPAEAVPAEPVPPGANPAGPGPARPAPAVGIERARTRSALVGRGAELEQVLGLLRRPEVRLVTLLGPGGVGKTRLAVEVAHLLAATPDCLRPGPPPLVITVPLDAVRDPVEVPAELCRSLGADPGWPGEDLLDVAVRTLAARPSVLVLDNLEQLAGIEGGLDDVVALLDRLPELVVLGTSRSVLRLAGEHLVPLAPLPLPDPDDDEVLTVLRSDAVRLFRDRAAAVLPGFEVTPANARAVAAVCRMLDGLPLALELAAARVRVLPPEQMQQRVGQRLALLTGGARDLPGRHRSLRAALDWSAALLDRDEARAFGQLSVFIGGWTLAAAEAVCGAGPGPDRADDRPGPGPAAQPVEAIGPSEPVEAVQAVQAVEPVEPVEVIEVLSRLADKSLVVADGSGRFGLLETVREYAAGSTDPAERRRAADRHARYFAALAERLAPRLRTAPDPRSRAELDAEAGNLGAAAEHALATGDGELLGRLVIGLLDYWFFSGRIRQADRWLAALAEADVPRGLRARLQLSAGSIALLGADLPRAAAAFTRSQAAATELGDRELQVRSAAARSVAARYAGDRELALAHLEAALRIALAGPADAPIIGQLENERGEVLDELGRPDEAARMWHSARLRAAAERNDSQLAYAAVNLAQHALEQGRPDEARAQLEAALAAAEASASAPVRADVLAAAGALELRAGRPARGVELLAAAVQLGHAAGQLLSLADTVSLLGAALLAAEHPGPAARMLAAGQAWRSARGLAVVGRLTRTTIAAAQDRLTARRAAGSPDEQAELAAGWTAGSALPFAAVPALDLPALDVPPVDHSPVELPPVDHSPVELPPVDHSPVELPPVEQPAAVVTLPAEVVTLDARARRAR